jgi:hypothetical protein
MPRRRRLDDDLDAGSDDDVDFDERVSRIATIVIWPWSLPTKELKDLPNFETTCCRK